MLNESMLAYCFGRQEQNEENAGQVQICVLERLIGGSIENVSFDVDDDGRAVTDLKFKGTLKELGDAVQTVMLNGLERQAADLKADKDRELEAMRELHVQEIEQLCASYEKSEKSGKKQAPIEAKAEVVDKK